MRIAIDGNIAAGKSSVIDMLPKAFPDIPVFPEPLEEWGSLLSSFYANPRVWALPLSLRILLSFRKPSARTTCIVERSPLSCRHVFTQLLYNDGTLAPAAWEVFKSYWELMHWLPDAIIYIETPANTCFERLQERGRDCEVAAVDITYLKRIEFQYQTMLKFNPKIPVVYIDGTQDADKVCADVEREISKLLHKS